MYYKLAGSGALLTLAWVGLQAWSNISAPSQAELMGLGPTPELTVEDVLADRERRTKLAQEIAAGTALPDVSGLSPLAAISQTATEAAFTADLNAALREKVAAEARPSDALTPRPFLPVLEERTSGTTTYLIQSSHPRPWSELKPGLRVDRVLQDALTKGSFEFGHFVRPYAETVRHELHPAVKVWSEAYPEGVLILETVFQPLLARKEAGTLTDPDLLPWAGLPVWTNRENVGQVLVQRPGFRTVQTLAEYVTDPLSPLCHMMYPTRTSGFAQLGQTMMGLAEPGALDQAFASEPKEDVVVQDDAPIKAEDVRRSIFDAAGDQLSVPETLVVPVRLTRDASGVISGVEAMKGYMEYQPLYTRDDPFVIDGTAYKCMPRSMDPKVLSASIAAVENGLSVSRIATIPGSSLLPREIDTAFLVLGNAVVFDVERNGHLNYAVGWEPLRLDFIEQDLMGFDGGYLGSWDFRAKAFTKIEKTLLNGVPQERQTPMEMK